MGRADHLKQYWFKPGQSGNPAGRQPDTTIEKEVRKFTREHVSEVYNKIIDMDKGELDALLADPAVPVFEKAVARAVLNAEKDGSVGGALETILERIIGKVPQKIEGNPDLPVFSFGEILKRAHPEAAGANQ